MPPFSSNRYRLCLGKHFDTAIDAMTMLLVGFKEESEAQNEE